MKSTVLATLAAAAALVCAAPPSSAQTAAAAPAGGATPRFEEGKHYQRFQTAQPTSSDTGKVEVAEVFMFGCPGCFGLEPHLEQWLATKPDYVSFVRIPASFNGLAEIHARAYYTAETLGKAEEIAGPFFNEVHVKHNRLDSEAPLAAFFARFGVDETTFKNTFYSFAVDAKLRRAADLIARYSVRATPTIVVNGKYLTSGTMAGSYEAWFAIIGELAATEHAAPPKPAQ